MKISKFLVLFVVLLSLAVSASAIELKGEKSAKIKEAAKAKVADQHPCKLEDILGGWHLIYYKQEPKDADVAEFRKQFPFEHMVFGATGKMAYMHENRPPPNLKGEFDHLMNKKDDDGFSFTLSKNGQLQVVLQKKPFETYWCQVVGATGGGYNEGDIIMTINATEKVSAVTKVFRKIVAP